MALLLASTTSPARADCPAAPIADPDDMAISFLASNGVQAGSASLLASTVKEGIVVYDDANDTLKLCDGDNWIAVGSGAGTDTLASLSCTSGQIAKYNGTAWACAADGGGSGTAVAFSVHKNGTNQAVTSGVTTALTWSTEVFDTNNNFNTGTGVFTPTVAGKYLVSLTVYCQDSTNYCQGFIYKNGANYQGTFTRTNAASDTVTALIDMNGTTDTISAYAHNSGGTIINGSAVNTYFSGFLVGGGADTLSGLSCAAGEIAKYNGTAWACAADGGGSGGGSVVAFSARRTAGNVASGNTVVFDSASINTGSGYNSATGVFTAPVAGTYQFSWGSIGNSSANDIFRLVLRKNGVSTSLPQARSYNSNGSEYPPTATAMGYLALAQGDTVNVHFQSDNGTALYGTGGYAFFNGHLLGGGSDTLAGLSCITNQIPKWDGTEWVCGSGSGGSSGTAVAFHVHKNGTNQTGVASGTTTQVTFSTETFDTNNNFDTGTGRFTPTVAGKYILTASTMWDAGVNGQFWITSIRKNGSVIAQNALHASSGASMGGPVSVIVDANGTTDYFDVTVYQNTGSARTISGSAFNTYFSGASVGGGGGGSSQWADVTGGLSYASGGAAVGTGTLNASAILQADSTTRGFLPPRMTTTQRDAIASPAEGLVVYNTTTKSLDLRVASSWLSFGGSMTGNTMVSGWPDAIRCDDSGTDDSTYVLGQHLYASSKAYYYRVGVTNSWIAFNNPGGTWNSRAGTEAADCVGQSIAQLYTAGRAFNFVGGATASADGSAGQVQFNEGGNLKADAALHWDNTNKRLGIGTASPQHKLDIVGGGISVDNNVASASYALRIAERASQYGANIMFLDGAGAGITGIGKNTSDDLILGGGVINNDHNQEVRIPVSGGMYVLGGNVGIGTAGPTSKLQITGTGTEDGIKVILADSNNILLGYATGGTNITHNLYSSGSTGLLALHAAGAEQVRLSSNGTSFLNGGNVGIGTASPGYKLDVAGVVNANSGGEWPVRIAFDTTTATNRTHFMTARSRAGGAVSSGDTLGGLAMGGKYDATNYAHGWNGGAEITAFASENWSSTARGADLSFFTVPNASTGIQERMRITNNGNVGIGTATPVGPGSAGARLKIVRTVGNWGLVVEGSGTSQSDILLHTPNNTVDMRAVQFVNSADKFTIRSLTDATVVSQNLFVADLANGNVGIGTSDPQVKLDVVGNINLQNTLTDATVKSGIISVGHYTNAEEKISVLSLVSDSTPNNIIRIGGGLSAQNSATKILFYTGDDGTTLTGTERMRIEESGYVGIAVAAPAYRLELPNTSGVGGRGRANQWTTYSDGRFKTEVHGIDHALDKVMALRGVTYTSTTEDKGERQVGFIAQEVEKVVPEVVSVSKTSVSLPDGSVKEVPDYRSMAYDRLVPVLSEAIKELKADNDNLRAEHEAELRSLREEINALKAAR